MRVKTQNFENSIPDIFLTYRKVFGFLFLFFINFIFAHVGISTVPTVKIEAESKLVSDSTISNKTEFEKSDRVIYLDPETIVIDLENTVEGKMVVVNAPTPDKKTIVQQVPVKKVIAKKNHSQYINKNSAQVFSKFYPSSQTDLYYSASVSHTRAIVPSQVSHFKSIIRSAVSIDVFTFEDLAIQNIFAAKHEKIVAAFQNIFSGRAPPSFS